MLTGASEPDLDMIAARVKLSPEFVLGLSVGLYFEYLRRPAPVPTHRISGLRRDLESTLGTRISDFANKPAAVVRQALRDNALRFNLDGAPPTALLGMELLAEELPNYGGLEDWELCLRGMALTIHSRDALYRRMYSRFLQQAGFYVTEAKPLSLELSEIADEWDAFADHLDSLSPNPDESQFERASRLLRRLALREEHFWGQILETVAV